MIRAGGVVNDYADATVDLIQEVAPPSYRQIVDLMQDNDGRHILFDFWARGNYTRRLIHQRREGITPVLVRVSRVEEIAWAYRRLALLGVPVEFIWCGELAEPAKVLHAHYRPAGALWDSGWGYLATQWKNRGRYCAMITGRARLMPESVFDWILEEAQDDFVAGGVFVAPAELIGVDSAATPESLVTLGTVANGRPIIDTQEIAAAVMELSFPYLDGLKPREFRKFIRDHEGELARFRSAFARLLRDVPRDAEQLRDWLTELKAEVAELTLSERYHRLRRTIVGLGGVLGTATAAVGMLADLRPESLLPVALGAGAGTAGAALLNLWKEVAEKQRTFAENPFCILWQLGLRRPTQVERIARVSVGNVPQIPITELPPTHHWLCPPTNGVWFAGVRKA